MITRNKNSLDQFRPEKPEVSKKEVSNFFPKDELFNKTKLFFTKGQEGQKEEEADWRNISLNGNKIVLFKGQAVSKSDLESFNKEARNHFLYERKSKPSTKKVEE